MLNFNRKQKKIQKKIWNMTKEPICLMWNRMQREVFAMKSYYVTFRSVTHGQRGEKLLREKGIRCNLLRTPRWMEAKGCGYSLRIWTEDINRLVALLRRNHVPMQRVYIQTPDGTLEEMNL